MAPTITEANSLNACAFLLMKSNNCPKIGKLLLIEESNSPNAALTWGIAALINVTIAPGRAFKILPTIGIKFPKRNVEVVSAN